MAHSGLFERARRASAFGGKADTPCAVARSTPKWRFSAVRGVGVRCMVPSDIDQSSYGRSIQPSGHDDSCALICSQRPAPLGSNLSQEISSILRQ